VSKTQEKIEATTKRVKLVVWLVRTRGSEHGRVVAGAHGAMPQQPGNGLADTLFKCVRCVHFICYAVICRRCRPKTKADDVLGPDAEEVVDVEGGHGPAAMDFSGHRDAAPPPALSHQERHLAQPVPQQLSPPLPVHQQQYPPHLQQLPSSAPVNNPSPQLRTAETAPSAFAAAAESAVPVHMATVLDNRGSLERQTVSLGAGRSEDEAYSDEMSEPEEEDDDDDNNDVLTDGAPNLLGTTAPVFDAPLIALTKMTPRATDDSSVGLAGGRAAMSSLPGAGWQQQRREKREEVLQELQVGPPCCPLSVVNERVRQQMCLLCDG
jgi:hypothetical protein